MNDSYNSNNYNNNAIKTGKRSRRSKNDVSGRNKQCKHCEKSYLSDIALNNHMKTKHSEVLEFTGTRSRGRPRKEMTNNSIPSQLTNISSFFDKEESRVNGNEIIDCIKVCEESLNNLYNKYKDIIFLNLSAPEDSTFINNSLSNKSVDEGFWKYLQYCSSRTNQKYFEYLFKFIVLFREFLNVYKGNDFTTTDKSNEVVPDLCNEFVGEFMEKHGYFGIVMSDLVVVIQHCCHWLWENGFTSSKLSLV